jgi:hypothetical protein
MAKTLTLKDLTLDEFNSLVSTTVKKTVKEAMEDVMEDMLALYSKEYINSIEEAREDYKTGRIKSIEEISNRSKPRT